MLVHYIVITGHLSEVKLNNYNAHPTSYQLKVCSDILSRTRNRTSWSSLVFQTLTLLREILLQAVNKTVTRFKYSSAFRIFIRKL